MPQAFVAIGSNLAPEENIRRALHLLAPSVSIVKISTIYRTRALGRPEQVKYLNGVVEIHTEIPPEELKTRILRPIEIRLGRVRGEDRFAPRTIDLDLILYDFLTANSPELTLPAPEILERPFVAVPLKELAPGLILPGINLSIMDIADSFTNSDMEPLFEYSKALRKEILG